MSRGHLHTFKKHARNEFARWSRTYDRSILQRMLFLPTFEFLLEEVLRWRQAGSGVAAPFRALDIGCGTGRWATILRRSALPASVVGLDYSIEMCKRAVNNARSVELNDIPILNGDSEYLPFADESFDLVSCTHSFHHYPHQAAVIRDMHRVLRPGGMLVLVDGFRDNIIGWFVFDVFVTRAEGAVRHVAWPKMRQLFSEAGFGDIRQRKFNIWAPACATIGIRAGGPQHGTQAT